VGGPLPLGYAMANGKVAILNQEAERVRHIFTRYLELGSVHALMRDLKERDIVSKRRLLKTGNFRGGIPFGRGALFYLLRNRFSGRSITRDRSIRANSLLSPTARCSIVSKRCSRAGRVIRPEPVLPSAIS